MRPIASPVITPWTRKSCHHCVHQLVHITERTSRRLPPLNKTRKRPLSIRGLTMVVVKNRRNTWTEPIQAIVEGLLVGRRTAS